MVTALHDALALKREIRRPVPPETRSAIEELENQIVALKLQLLRSHIPTSLCWMTWKTPPRKANKRPVGVTWRRDPCPVAIPDFQIVSSPTTAFGSRDLTAFRASSDSWTAVTVHVSPREGYGAMGRLKNALT